MGLYLGIDTSNYTTSAAIYDSNYKRIINCKKLLPVENGEVGLMQSKALFNHIKQLPEVIESAFSQVDNADISAVCVSSRPRNVDGSYMPVFLSGVAAAEAIASSHRVKCYKSAHQVGHILAALFSADRLDLINQPFYAFHISGGTTECLLVTPDDKNIINCEVVAKSLDLKAGQAIDRIGVKMGLSFPAGAELDKLSKSGNLTKKPKITLKGCDCCLSGLQNICENMLFSGEKNEDVARYIFEYLYLVISKMSEKVVAEYGEKPFLYAGGVMSNSIISKRLNESGGIFAKPEFSSDNAAGIALAGYLMASV